MASQAVVLVLTNLIILYGEQVYADCGNITDFSTQLDTVLAEYDRDTPPSSLVTIKLSLDPRHASIQEDSSTARMLADLQMNWEDSRITWNSTNWDCDSALVPAERLWLPDVALLNAASTGEEAGLRARLTSDGRITWLTRFDVKVPVAMQLKDWPYDEQTISFKFASREHSLDEMLLELSEQQQSTVSESGMWQLVAVTGSSRVWTRGTEARSLISWQLTLHRRGAAHAWASTAVLCTTVLLIVAAMVLPPEHRNPLYATAAFIAALWLISALIRLPSSATTPTLLALQCTLCTLAAVLTISAALVTRVARFSSSPPQSLRQFLFTVTNICKLSLEEDLSTAGAWKATAHLLDMILLTLSAVVLIVLSCYAVSVL
ncbi:neuronal acetylcholine receptor subunit beta-4-like [Achroia grisella]|uniref:neuronal acetylcholine receptor subunit beta-4-like n=1 Tax=Achroia grisella TaxID=688607 RepID=UPI0027D312A9|nr:neuronal acetylcholine receptor subunit beta-4-like [Achroia grisella]